jgi:hypothetical protein
MNVPTRGTTELYPHSVVGQQCRQGTREASRSLLLIYKQTSLAINDQLFHATYGFVPYGGQAGSQTFREGIREALIS